MRRNWKKKKMFNRTRSRTKTKTERDSDKETKLQRDEYPSG